MTHKDVRRFARQIDRHVSCHGLGSIGSRWQRFDYTVRIRHGDGTRLTLCHAYAVLVVGVYLIVTEHHGHFVYPADELKGIRMESWEAPDRAIKIPRLRLKSDLPAN